ncbi:uncharacterized protein LOC110835681 isoform X2 [Zootermopsis nevadensis]|uniref:uncharacterized protein LOC110835681 isoform X2 n=1 Tax=Zootermopsis nevadensis TaxID=136037 RepID=UPI000B8E910B|nr:uncharacterized protein LOC110835681 isoform X2 [Zootermopsis nevadensis]
MKKKYLNLGYNLCIIKIENDVGVQSEIDSIGMVSDEVHVQSGTSVKKDETEMMNIRTEEVADTQEEEDPITKHPLIKCEHTDSMNLQKVVPDSYGETSLEICYDDNQVIDIKVEDVGGVKKEEENPGYIAGHIPDIYLSFP